MISRKDDTTIRGIHDEQEGKPVCPASDWWNNALSMGKDRDDISPSAFVKRDARFLTIYRAAQVVDVLSLRRCLGPSELDLSALKMRAQPWGGGLNYTFFYLSEIFGRRRMPSPNEIADKRVSCILIQIGALAWRV